MSRIVDSNFFYVDSIQKFLIMFSSFIPVIFPLSAVASSIIDSSFKGFIYILGILISFAFVNFVYKSTGMATERAGGVQKICNLYSNDNYYIADSALFILSFTLFYVCIFPMARLHTGDATKILLCLFPTLTLMIISAYIRLYIICCSRGSDIVMGILSGVIFAAAWYFLVGGLSSFNSGLTYFEDENKPCVRVDGGTVFKCSKKEGIKL